MNLCSGSGSPLGWAEAVHVHSRLLDALDNTPTFFAMTDAGGALCYLNRAGQALLGLQSQEDAQGMSLLECHAPGVREHLMQAAMPAAARDGSWSGDSVLLAHDGRQIRTTLVLIAQHGDDGQLVGFSAQERDMTGWIRAEDAMCISRTELRRLAVEHLNIQEAERRRITAELHDGLGQSLSLLKLAIQEALRQMNARVPRKAVESVKQLLPKIGGALDELRRVSMELRPSSLDDLGLLPTLSWFVREFEAANPETRIEKQVSVGEKDVPEHLRIVIFRILQEAVNNAPNHAEVECIKIGLHSRDDILSFTVEVDGKGYDRSALAKRDDAGTGLRIKSLRERAELSGGTCTVASAPGHGIKVCVRWPALKTSDAVPGQPVCVLCGLQPSLVGDGANAQACHCSEVMREAQFESNA
jgi:PAS domain S-box-containing protein